MAFGDTIDATFITQFSDTVYEMLGQTQARTRPYVNIEPLNSEEKMFDRIGHVDAQVINDKYQKVDFTQIEWDRRRVKAARVGVALPIDQWDAKRMLTDPNSPLAKRAVQALEREFDRFAIAAVLEDVYTGRNGTVPKTAAQDGVEEVDATGGLTYEKLLEVSETFMGKEVGTDVPIRKVLFITEQEMTALMKEAELTSGDFSRQYVIDKGIMTRALDFEIVVFGSKVARPMLKVDNDNTRHCIAMAADAITVGITQSWMVKHEERNELWDTEQIKASGILGALRMDGNKLIDLQTTAVV